MASVPSTFKLTVTEFLSEIFCSDLQHKLKTGIFAQKLIAKHELAGQNSSQHETNQ